MEVWSCTVSTIRTRTHSWFLGLLFFPFLAEPNSSSLRGVFETAEPRKGQNVPPRHTNKRSAPCRSDAQQLGHFLSGCGSAGRGVERRWEHGEPSSHFRAAHLNICMLRLAEVRTQPQRSAHIISPAVAVHHFGIYSLPVEESPWILSSV